MSEILCKTNPSSIDPERVGGTGCPELTPSEIASMLHGSCDGTYYIGMCVHTGQYSKEKVSGYLYDLIKSGDIKVKSKRGDELKKPIYSRMSFMVVSEVVSGNKCPACNGTKLDVNKINSCCTCGGNGVLNPSDEWKSKQCYADDWGYWRSSYNHLFDVVNGWLFDADMRIRSEVN